jgi:four helix bundle protein
LEGDDVGFPFENLDVYQMAVVLVEEIHSATNISTQGYGHVVSQLRRAATSIPLNIAEGYGRFNPAEKRRFYQIARASCYESAAALALCGRCKLLKAEAVLSAEKQLDRIGKMLTALIRVTEERSQRTGTGEG